ncbi:MAG TPA: hypothetical protein PKK94_25775, partial [Leptospiraceae bacterium]|nr:hypothetical protein [Leptospiraceae bacterium]
MKKLLLSLLFICAPLIASDFDSVSDISSGDCKGIASGDKSWCTTNDCKGIASKDKSWCKSSDCKG